MQTIPIMKFSYVLFFLASWIPYVLFSNEGMKKELKWHA